MSALCWFITKQLIPSKCQCQLLVFLMQLLYTHELIFCVFATFRVVHYINQLLNLTFLLVLMSLTAKQLRFLSGDEFTTMFLISTGVVFAFPGMACCIIQDWRGIVYGTINAIPYLLFRGNETLAFSYGIAQFWNLTWGTRPHDNKSPNGQDYERAMVQIYRASRIIMIAYLAFNLAMATLIMLLVKKLKMVALVGVYATFTSPLLIWYPFAAVFFAKYSIMKSFRLLEKKDFRSVLRPKLSTLRSAKSKKVIFLALVTLSHVFGVLHVSKHIKLDTSNIDGWKSSEKVPFVAAVQQCTTLECLKEAHTLTSVNMEGAKFNFPHALFIGWQDTRAELLQGFIRKHVDTVKVPDDRRSELMVRNCMVLLSIAVSINFNILF